MTEPRPPLALEIAVSRYEYGDALAAQISSAISLKRIADMLEAIIDHNRDQQFGAAIRTQPGEPR
jgi:hypothetical protein